MLRRSRRADRFFVGVSGNGPHALCEERAAEEPELIHYLPYTELPPLVMRAVPEIGTEERRMLLALLTGLLRWEPDCRWNGTFALGRLWITPPAERT